MDGGRLVAERSRPEFENEGRGSQHPSVGDGTSVAEQIGLELESKDKSPDGPSMGDGTLIAERSGPEPEKKWKEPNCSPLGEVGFGPQKYSAETVGVEDERAGEAIQAPDLLNPVEATPQLCADKWPALFADGKTDIHFDDEDFFWSFSNEVKGSIESFIGAPVNWWPLSARRRPLPDGFSRVKWKCVSRTFPKNGKTSLITLSIQRYGRTLSGTMSTARRDQYEQWLSACNSEPPAQSAPLPLMDREGGPGTPTSSGSNGISSGPPSPHQDSFCADGAGQGNSLNGSLNGQDPTTYEQYLFWCVVKGLIGPTVVRSIRLAKGDKDEQVFNKFRVEYYRTRGFWGRVSLHTVAEIRYVKVR